MTFIVQSTITFMPKDQRQRRHDRELELQNAQIKSHAARVSHARRKTAKGGKNERDKFEKEVNWNYDIEVSPASFLKATGSFLAGPAYRGPARSPAWPGT
jgi:3-methyladenine DNA glycosylase/8-oxoguanine DNA glycosylase